MADYRWTMRTSEWRTCEGCKRDERLVKTRQQFKDEDGKIQTKVTGTWVPFSKSKDVQHNTSCVLVERVATKK